MRNEYKLLPKTSKLTEECVIMLEEAAKYTKKTSPIQATIMKTQFEETRKTIERMPTMGTLHKNGIRKIKLGKFKYYVYYREKEDIIEILGIHHTRKGTEFLG